MAIAILAALTIMAGVAGATSAVTVDVYASSAPNYYGSPSWAGYEANGVYALENGLSTYGDPTLPTAYAQLPAVVGANMNASTSFNSWQGNVNPTGAFANELGNRIHFGLVAFGDGTTKIALNDLTFAINSNDAGDSMNYTGDFQGSDYNGTSRIGIIWGTGGKANPSTYTVLTSGNGTTPVDEIVYIGVGNSWWPQVTSDLPTPAAAMNDYYATMNAEGPITITGSYSIDGFTGSDSVAVAPVPEPVTMVSAFLAIGGLGGYIRKRMKAPVAKA
jgi:hypothetical protein